MAVSGARKEEKEESCKLYSLCGVLGKPESSHWMPMLSSEELKLDSSLMTGCVAR